MKVPIESITNRILSGSATIIAIIALATALYQARLSRDQAKASVWPYLVQGNSGNNGYSRIVQNVGLGPALIRGFEVLVDGKPTRNWTDAAAKLGIHPTWRGKRSTTFRAGLVVPTGGLIELLNLPDTADERMIRGAIDHLQTWVCYCSLYGDCWESRSNDYDPKPIKACKDDPARRFVE
ncbi:MAG: hypothetical protein QOJ64_796 [Acidobacteriota bacterium]|nr:hypothetical protein [Acidobacteriota bacterium]